MIDPRRALRVGLLQLEEGVLADLEIDRRRLSLGVAVPERLFEPQLLGVERRRVGNARHAEPHMVQDDTGGIVLCHGDLDGQSTKNSCDEQHKTAHDALPSITQLPNYPITRLPDLLLPQRRTRRLCRWRT